jgi:hypothetical protein
VAVAEATATARDQLRATQKASYRRLWFQWEPSAKAAIRAADVKMEQEIQRLSEISSVAYFAAKEAIESDLVAQRARWALEDLEG